MNYLNLFILLLFASYDIIIATRTEIQHSPNSDHPPPVATPPVATPTFTIPWDERFKHDMQRRGLGTRPTYSTINFTPCLWGKCHRWTSAAQGRRNFFEAGDQIKPLDNNRWCATQGENKEDQYKPNDELSRDGSDIEKDMHNAMKSSKWKPRSCVLELGCDENKDPNQDKYQDKYQDDAYKDTYKDKDKEYPYENDGAVAPESIFSNVVGFFEKHIVLIGMKTVFTAWNRANIGHAKGYPTEIIAATVVLDVCAKVATTAAVVQITTAATATCGPVHGTKCGTGMFILASTAAAALEPTINTQIDKVACMMNGKCLFSDAEHRIIESEKKSACLDDCFVNNKDKVCYQDCHNHKT